MCGICLFQDSSVPDVEVREVFNQLLFLNMLRGKDSTGVVSILKPSYSAPGEVTNNIVRVIKSTVPSPDFIASDEYKRVLNTLGSNHQRTALFGHCRAATKGHISAENAHPFITTNLVGVHNGTIVSGLNIPDGETDSQALFELIDNKGVSSLKDIKGAYALIWYDKRDGNIYFLRNNERSLFFGWKNNSIVVSSEERHLKFLGGIFDIEAAKPFHLYSIKIDRKFLARADKLVVVDMTKELEEVVRTYNTNGRFQSGVWKNGVYNPHYSDNDKDYEDVSGRVCGEVQGDKWGYGLFKGSSKRVLNKQGKKENESTSFFRKGEDDLFQLPGTEYYLPKLIAEGCYEDGCSVCNKIASKKDWVHFNKVDGVFGYVCEDCASDEGLKDTVETFFPGAVERYKDYERSFSNAV